MIPLYKLEKLPRIHKLRKITNIFTEAENRQCRGIHLNAAELTFFADAAHTLSADTAFPPAAQAALNDAAAVLRQAALQPESAALAVGIRRALNHVKHLLLAETGRSQADWDFTGGDGRLDPSQRTVFEGMLVYLEDIRSPFNVGAMFRTAESFGAERMFLSPLCADPTHLRARRTAMGCVDVLPWERREFFVSAEDSTENPELPTPVFALETGGVPLSKFPFPRRGLLIVGSEELGISPRALAAADASSGRVSIPCYGAKGSLNVSVAFGIVMQAWAAAIQKYA